ncbi:glycosyltransferase family 2 protein [Flavihumibacter sp. RY-1]|uniref:Glycosyltransferase family 2 protein n=1 Tax=Flavihumibacter fluminis TaxID=2909236 RepID=A0ABS9BLC0_9BACT|nr:glycosyltransferase family 2 protein [Flavihumibacter fluminis]MCF1716390.1 glycosyltransferase family 2 protein [Flavihumibacter fluminis]
MMFEYRFTVFTPCFNSEKFLHRVFESLQNQTFLNFEWLVINDASTDGTDDLIKRYIDEAKFPVRYFNLTKNQMIAANYNLAIKESNGEFLIPFGHDDRIFPNALERFDEILRQYDGPNISAVYCLCENQHGRLVSDKYPEDFQISDYFTMFFSLGNEAEKFQCFKTSVLRQYPPLRVDIGSGIPAAWLWGMVGCDFKAIFVNEILRVYYIEDNNPNSLSKSKRTKNPEAIWYYYLYWVNKFQYKINSNYKRRLRGILGYASYGLYARKSIAQMLEPITRLENKLIILLLVPLAYILNWKNS